jgi:peptide/nickel transport system permease protein
MIRYFVRRLAMLLVSMFVLSMVIFVLSDVVPIEPALMILGRESTPEARAALTEELGLNRPLPVRYVEWLTRFISGDWGVSYRLGVDILPVVQRRLANSLVLAAAALMIMVPVALGLGILAGLREGRRLDRAISVSSLVSISIPDFVVGLVLIILFSWWLKLLPADSGLRGDNLDLVEHWRKLILPAITAALVLIGYVARVTRVSMINTMASPYIRTAVLKGLPYRTVVMRHALRNALIAPVAVITTQIAFLVGGLIVIERLFNYPGIGSLFAEAALRNDLPMIQASAMIAITLVVLSQGVADLLYVALNPRIQFS